MLIARLTKSIERLWAPVHQAARGLAKRCYREQLMADELSFFRAMVCGVTYVEYRQLRQMYALISVGAASSKNPENGWGMAENDIFLDSYWLVLRDYQPWVIAHYHRSLGLQKEDPFYQNPTTERTWLYSDITDLDIPCSMIWDWLLAATPNRLESACLLSSFSHKTLFGELSRRVREDPNADRGYLFASMAMAMVFRMGLEALAEDFAQEADEWKNMYANWDMESRLFLLSVLACLDRQESREYMYAWGPELFPEASFMLDVARGTDVHPARLVRQWYDQRGAPGPESLTIEGLV